LEANGHTSARVIRWSDFREDFFENYVDHRSDSDACNVASTFNVIGIRSRFQTLIRRPMVPDCGTDGSTGSDAARVRSDGGEILLGINDKETLAHLRKRKQASEVTPAVLQEPEGRVQ